MAIINPLEWNNKQIITIDHAKVVGGPHSNFPVLISLVDPFVGANANADGFDIVFTDSDGITLLDFEYELWDKGTGTLVAHVKVPSVDNITDKIIFMYFGKPGALDLSSASGVWDSNYTGVYHLEGSYNATAGEVKDSTSGDNHGTANAGNVPTQIDAKIGKGQRFDEDTTEAIELAASSTLLPSNQDFTIEVWFKQKDATTPVGQRRIYNIRGSAEFSGLTVHSSSAGSLFVQTYEGSSFNIANLIDTIANLGTSWHYLVIKRTSTNTVARLDGVQKVNDAETFDTIGAGTAALSIISVPWDGDVDEFKVSKILRSDDWLDTCYNNQNSPGTFYSVDLVVEGATKILVDQSKTSAFNFGLGDETGYNNILTASPGIEYVHPDEKVKNLKVKYRKNNRENDVYLHEIERSSSTNGVDQTISLPFVYDHDTADMVLDYKRKRFAAAVKRLNIEVGQDAVNATRGELATINIPSLDELSDWEITGSNVTPAGSQSLSLVPYSVLSYTYVPFTSEGGTLPVDESFDITPDFTLTNPDPVSNLVVSMLMDTVGTNAFPYAELTWDPPEDNFSGALVSVKLTSDPDTAYKSKGAYESSARIDGLTPGQLYDFKVEALNITGEFKSIAAEDTSNLAGGDSTAPNIPTGLNGSAKFGRLIWIFNKSTSNDVAFHEAEVYTASSGGSLLYATTILNDDEARVEFERQTGDLTSSALSGWCQVRAVDYSGNASSYTSRVQATTGDIVQGDVRNNEITDSSRASNAGPIETNNGTLVSTSINVRGYAVLITAQCTATNDSINISAGNGLAIARGGSDLVSIVDVHRGLTGAEETTHALTYLDTSPGSGVKTYSLECTGGGQGDSLEFSNMFILVEDLRR